MTVHFFHDGAQTVKVSSLRVSCVGVGKHFFFVATSKISF